MTKEKPARKNYKTAVDKAWAQADRLSSVIMRHLIAVLNAAERDAVLYGAGAYKAHIENMKIYIEHIPVEEIRARRKEPGVTVLALKSDGLHIYGQSPAVKIREMT
ncbi:hypothetical protein AAIR98_001446 [Elusimicrobium simillimum]|uniref:hypothetical protein n=1 Tax=Elusimicrobium simillimum TaxID=3143438 RepID=UPI003C6F8F1E